jgi:hypothetical protein
MTRVLDDGHAMFVTFSLDAAVKVKEKEVTPPSIDGGGKIATSTMHNTTVLTFAPNALYEVGDTSLTVAYDPAVLAQIQAMVNQPQTITLTWPDATTKSFGGWIGSFTPGTLTRGEQPTAEMVIHCSCQATDGSEVVPTL